MLLSSLLESLVELNLDVTEWGWENVFDCLVIVSFWILEACEILLASRLKSPWRSSSNASTHYENEFALQ